MNEAVNPRSNTGGQEHPDFAFKDLREWLAAAEGMGEVTVVRGADTERDIGMAAELVMRSESANCVVFDDIPGYPPKWRVLVNFFGGRRRNMTLGFPSDYTKVQLSEALYAVRMQQRTPIHPEHVQTGPVLANVIEGDELDVTRFPSPIWHPGDGGAYIGTGCFHVTRDPDTGRINLGTYRSMVHDKRTVGSHISPGKQGRLHRDRYFARGEPMPVCVVLGGDPLTFLAACSELPADMPEYEFVGSMRGEPVKVVTGKYTGLPFPADAEIVLEGFVDPVERRPDGPFGEWTGHYGGTVQDEPVIHVKAIYHRDEPIILGCPPQRPPDEMCRYRAIIRSAMLRANIEHAGVPGVTAAWAHETGNSRTLLAVAIDQRYPGHAKQAGHIAAMCHVGAYAGRYVIVVDDDIDVSDLEELMWATTTRSDPASGIDIITGAWSTPLDPSIPPTRKSVGDMTNSRAIIDACRPYHWKDAFPEVNAPPRQVAETARAKFGWLLDNGSVDPADWQKIAGRSPE
ncbi:MAG: UbiD family decarboxylase [Alphaproteobacteria bacterium]